MLATSGPGDQRQTRGGQLDRLSQLHGTKFDLAFLKVMAARHRADIRMARVEARHGGVPEVRQLARQMLAELEPQAEQMTAWRRARAKDDARRRES